MNHWIKVYLFSVLSLPGFNIAQSVPDADTQDSVLTHTIKNRTAEVITTDAVSARRQWNLTEEEWLRYEQVMVSPRGRLSPNITPIQALGVTAETDAERHRYALLQAELQIKRDYEDLLWQAYVNRAKESPEIRSLAARLEKRHQSFMSGDEDPLPSHWKDYRGEALVFASVDCLVECKALTLTAIDRKEVTRFIIAGARDDDQLRKWAQKMAIPAELTKLEQVTLHHDKNYLQATGYGNAALPLVLAKTVDGYKRLER